MLHWGIGNWLRKEEGKGGWSGRGISDEAKVDGWVPYMAAKSELRGTFLMTSGTCAKLCLS